MMVFSAEQKKSELCLKSSRELPKVCEQGNEVNLQNGRSGQEGVYLNRGSTSEGKKLGNYSTDLLK